MLSGGVRSSGRYAKTAAEGGPEKFSAGAPGLEGADSNDSQKASICKGFRTTPSADPVDLARRRRASPDCGSHLGWPKTQ
jgi:hypothetical protein